MTVFVRTVECFPGMLSSHVLFPPVSNSPRHADCPGGFHVKGVLGGWDCPCPCHTRAVTGEQDQP